MPARRVVALTKATETNLEDEESVEDAQESGEIVAETASEQRHPESGAFPEATADRRHSAPGRHPTGSPTETPMVAPTIIKPAAVLVDVDFGKADREAEETEKDMQELALSTVELYPESRIVILLACLCIIWIIFIVLTVVVKHGVYTPDGNGTTNCTWPPTTATTTMTRHPINTPTYTRTTTEEPLRGIFYCDTDYCKKEGDHLRSLTTQSSKKPCENFYEHVCEAWRTAASQFSQNYPGAAVSTDTLIQASIEAQLLSYVADARNSKVSPARVLYDLCVKGGNTDAELLDAANDLFRSWGHQWPLTDDAGISSADVWRFAAKLMRVLGVPSLIGVEIGLDPRNFDENIIELIAPKSILPTRAVLLSNDVSQQRVMTLFREATQEAARAFSAGDARASNVAANDVRMTMLALARLELEDLGSSPLEFEVERLDALGTGVQAFLKLVFENVKVLDSDRRILVKRGRLVRIDLDQTVESNPPRATLNYLGLLALVALSPFLPEGLTSLRVLHSVHTLGRAEKGSREVLCLRAVSQAYPACIAEASKEVHKDVHRDMWLSQLETLFVGFTHDVTWMDNLTSLLVRYKMHNHRIARFFPAWPLGECGSPKDVPTSNALGAYVAAIQLRQKEQLDQVRLITHDRTQQWGGLGFLTAVHA
ncbi:uncharacterized protein LOC144144744 [Haemaphysalis longicornis]